MEEIASLKDKVSALEDQLVRLQPLEALMAYMQQSSDNTVLALLAAHGVPMLTAVPKLPARHWPCPPGRVPVQQFQRKRLG